MTSLIIVVIEMEDTSRSPRGMYILIIYRIFKEGIVDTDTS